MGYTSKSVSIFYVSLVGIAKTFYIYTSIIFSFRSRQEGKTIIILPLFIKKKILNKSNFRLRGFTHRVSHVLGSEALHTGFRMTLIYFQKSSFRLHTSSLLMYSASIVSWPRYSSLLSIGFWITQ